MTRDVSRNLNDSLPDGRPVKRFYALQDFFVNYFNEDWMLDDVSPDAVVGRFKAEAANAVPAVLDELNELLSLDVLDPMLGEHVLARYDLSYEPTRDGLTMGQWLRRVQRLLAAE